jgi:hypothetical protein
LLLLRSAPQIPRCFNRFPHLSLGNRPLVESTEAARQSGRTESSCDKRGQPRQSSDGFPLTARCKLQRGSRAGFYKKPFSVTLGADVFLLAAWLYARPVPIWTLAGPVGYRNDARFSMTRGRTTAPTRLLKEGIINNVTHRAGDQVPWGRIRQSKDDARSYLV